MFGSHKIAPSISPNKTIEGLVGGFVIGTMGFWFAGLYQDWLSGVDALIIGAAVAAVAPLGDLFESMLKRDLGTKDTGTLFGPHGGILDRLDAVLFTDRRRLLPRRRPRLLEESVITPAVNDDWRLQVDFLADGADDALLDRLDARELRGRPQRGFSRPGDRDPQRDHGLPLRR